MYKTEKGEKGISLIDKVASEKDEQEMLTNKIAIREIIKDLPKEDMRTIGFDIKTVQYGYPIGMPLTRILHGTGGLEEVRCNISNGIARVIFYVEDNTMVLLHAFIKKTQETPKKELDVAIKRYKDLCKR